MKKLILLLALTLALISTQALSAVVTVPPQINTWFSLGTGIGLASNTKILDNCPPNQFNGDYYPFHDGCKYVTIAWSSGFLDPDQNIAYWTGGGHNNYNGNEVYALDLKTLSLTRTFSAVSPTTPSAPAPPSATIDCIPLDGSSPCVSNAKHNYDGLVWMSKQKKAALIGGSPARAGNFVATIWTYDPYASSPSVGWVRRSSNFRSTSGGMTVIGIPIQGSDPLFASAYDPDNDIFYVFDQINLYAVDFNANTIRSLTNSSRFFRSYIGMQIDTKRKVLFIMGGGGIDPGGTVGFATIDISGGPTIQVPSTGGQQVIDRSSFGITAGGSPVLGTASPGLVYDPDLDRWVAWGACGGGGGACPGGQTGTEINHVFVFNPDKVLANDTSMLSIVNTTGAQSSNIEVGTGNIGVNGRFSYSPKSRLYIYCGDIAANCLALRLTPPDNVVTVGDVSGSNQTNRPVTVGRPFRQGDIPNCVSAYIGGSPVTTQTDVKNRWPDGSLKIASVSFIVPSITANGSVDVTLLNGSTCNNSGGLTQANALGGAYDFDVTTTLTGGSSGTQTSSARTLLSGGLWRKWLDGPIVSSFIIEDRTSALTGDLSPNGQKDIHPITEARFYPQGSRVWVSQILENDWVSNTQALSTRDETFTYGLTRGNSSPVSQAVNWAGATTETFSAHPFTGMGRSHITFWATNAPGSIVIDHNLNYIKSTGLIVNYDTSVAENATQVSNRKTNWTSTNKTIQGSFTGSNFIGFWERSGSDGGGGHPWVGLYPTWDTQYLYNMSSLDPILEQMFLRNADLHMRLQIHNRERDTSAGRGGFYDNAYSSAQTPTFGRPMSISARREVSTQDYSDSCSGTIGVDKINTGPVTIEWTSYSPRYAPHHAPTASYLQYLLSGYYAYMEEAQFDGSYYLAWAHGCVDTSSSPGGSRQGAKGYFIGGASNEIRGLAWMLRSLGYAAVVSPDSTPEQTYYLWYTGQNRAILEGATNNTNTDPAHLTAWTYGHSFQLPSDGASPIGMFQRYLDDGGSPPSREDGTPPRNVQNCNGAGFTCGNAPWMEHFLTLAMCSLNDSGIDFSTLLNFRAKYDFGLSIGIVDPANGDAYRHPGKVELSYAGGSGQGWLPSWNVLNQYVNPLRTVFSTNTGSDQQYEYFTLAAMACLGNSSAYSISGSTAYSVYRAALDADLTAAGNTLAQHVNGSITPTDIDTDSFKNFLLPRALTSSVTVPPQPPGLTPPTGVTTQIITP